MAPGKSSLLTKPPIGAPCNGCGLCCRAWVCYAGSYTLGLVERYGERAPGPCPALIEREDGGGECGLVLRPKDHAPGKGSAHELRAAIKIMLGAGAGCDEAGDPPEPDADRKLRELQQRFLANHGREAINKAVKLWFGL